MKRLLRFLRLIWNDMIPTKNEVYYIAITVIITVIAIIIFGGIPMLAIAGLCEYFGKSYTSEDLITLTLGLYLVIVLMVEIISYLKNKWREAIYDKEKE